MNNQMVLSFPIQWACELIWVAVVVYIITVPVDGGSFFFSHLKFVKREIGSYQKIKSKYNPYPCTPTSFLRNVAARVILGWAFFFCSTLYLHTLSSLFFLGKVGAFEMITSFQQYLIALLFFRFLNYSSPLPPFFFLLLNPKFNR